MFDLFASFLRRLLLFLPVLTPLALVAQAGAPPARDTTQKLQVETAEVVEGFAKNGREMRKLSGNVRLRQEKTLIYCDTAIIDDYTNNALLKNNVVIEQGDSVRVFSDSAAYFAAIKTSELYNDVVLVNGKQQLFTNKLRYDMVNKIATYNSGATLTNGKSQLSSQRGHYHVKDKMVYFKGEVIATDPEFTMHTDTLTFNTETQILHFVAPTLITQRKGKIYTEGGFYDIENDFAEFDLNPQYEKEGQRGKARFMRYSGTTKEYILEGEAEIVEKSRVSKADVIRFNSETEQSVLRGNAFYKDSVRTIAGSEIRYNGKTKSYQLGGRGRVIDPPNIIEADSLDFNDQLGNGLASGSVFWVDTSSDVSILAYRIDYNKQSDYINAFGGFGERAAKGRPVMKSLIDGDTLYLSADTLTSFKIDTFSDRRKLLAHRDVRIFKSDLQGICDSLAFDSSDSIFYFYKLDSLHRPILWSDTSQFSADTIRMLLKNKEIDRIWLQKNALIINSEDGIMFNQIKGRDATAYFRQEEIREMYVEGNAQAIYYALDDKKAYIGVNETACSEMRLYFGNNKVESVKFYREPSGKFTPMKKAGTETKKLEGFFWETKRRPMVVEDVFE